MACPLSEPPSVNGVPANPEISVSVALPVSKSVRENAGDATATLAMAAPPSARAKAVLVVKDVYPGIEATPFICMDADHRSSWMGRRREPRRGFCDRKRLWRQRDGRHMTARLAARTGLARQCYVVEVMVGAAGLEPATPCPEPAPLLSMISARCLRTPCGGGHHVGQQARGQPDGRLPLLRSACGRWHGDRRRRSRCRPSRARWSAAWQR